MGSPDFRARTAELADFVAAARKAYALPPPIALGFSNGANIAWSLLLHDPELLAGAILMRAMMPFDPRPLPDLDGVPVLILAGASDPLVPADQAALLAAFLGEAGADVTYEVVQGGHGLTGDDLSLAGSWLAKHGSFHLARGVRDQHPRSERAVTIVPQLTSSLPPVHRASASSEIDRSTPARPSAPCSIPPLLRRQPERRSKTRFRHYFRAPPTCAL